MVKVIANTKVASPERGKNLEGALQMNQLEFPVVIVHEAVIGIANKRAICDAVRALEKEHPEWIDAQLAATGRIAEYEVSRSVAKLREWAGDQTNPELGARAMAELL